MATGQSQRETNVSSIASFRHDHIITIVDLPPNPMVVVNHSDWKLQHIPMHSTSDGLFKHGYSFGTPELDVTIGGIHIDESRAIVYRTKPNVGLPISSQVH